MAVSSGGLAMSKIGIVTDSVAQLPLEIAEQYDIGVIPFSIIIENESYLDGIDIQASELYQRMRTEEIIPRTSQPSLGEYANFFRQRFEEGCDSVCYLTLSEKLSGGFSTASKAAHLLTEEFPDHRIAVVDSGTATVAQGFLAIQAALAVRQGAALDELVHLVHQNKREVGFIAMLDTLYYLERGGRIGKAAYLAGSLIQIKPMVTINSEGVVAPMGNLRGDKRCPEKLVDCLADVLGDRVPAQIAVMHADEEEKAEKLKQAAEDRFNLEVRIVTSFTPVMGAHAGPGVLGLGYSLV
jgi:DegV family protein with EDD domain